MSDNDSECNGSFLQGNINRYRILFPYFIQTLSPSHDSFSFSKIEALLLHTEKEASMF